MRFAAIYDKNKVCLTTFVYSGQTEIEISVADVLQTYPDAWYIRFCGGLVDSDPTMKKTEINAKFNSVAFIDELFSGYNRISDEIYLYRYRENIITDGSISAFSGYQDGNGVIQGLGVDTNWFNTQFIPVIQGDTIKVKNIGGQGSAVMTVGFFDIQKNCLVSKSYCAPINLEHQFEINDPEIAFVRFSGGYDAWFSQFHDGKCYPAVYVVCRGRGKFGEKDEDI